MIRTETSETAAAGQLRAFFERWQRLEEEKKTLSDDLKELFAEAKGTGFDTKAMRTVFREQVGDQAKLQESEAICDLYRAALQASARPARSTRENIEKFPPKEARADAGANIRMVHSDIRQPDAAPAVAGGAVETATEEPFEPPAFLRQDKPLRPHCRRPDDCAGYGKNHCHTCKEAMAEEVAA